MRPFLILLLAAAVTTSAQVRRTVKETFDRYPYAWSWATNYDDQNLFRQCGKGSLRATVRNGNNYFSMMYRPIDARYDWRIRTTCTIETSPKNEGLCVMITAQSENFYFKIAGGYRSQWVGSYNNTTQKWTNITVPDARGLGDKACPQVRPNGSSNVLEVRASKGTITFLVNDTIVDSWPISGAFAPLSTSIDAFGLCFSGSVTGRFDDFYAEYTERALPIVADAFVGAQRAFLADFAGTAARYPVIAPNGKQIYYIKNEQGAGDDIYVADATSDSTWTRPRLIGTPINNKEANNVISVSQDGNELFIWGLYREDGSGNGGGFSTTRRTNAGWSVPTPIKNNHQVSTSSTREECLSADRRVMIASRQIDGATIGNKDLYVSFRQDDGSYGPLINLGTAVNTASSDGAPFLAADGRTLYFASDDGGYGNSDMYVTKRLDDTWLNWSPRINLGPTINTPFWDCYFTIHPSGKYAYLNTSNGDKDGIYRVSLPQDKASRNLLPDPVVIVSGTVYHARTKKPLGVDIHYENLATGAEIGRAVSEPTDGRYSIILTGGTNYGFFAEKDGFFPVSDNIELTSLKSYQEIKRDLYLEPIEAGALIRLNNLFFDTDKAILRTESTSELDRLIALLKGRPTLRVSIEGHTDDRGTPQHNATLSQARADAVLAYLSSKGIDAGRLSASGFGKTKPLMKGASDSARQKNRRVEFRIVSL